MVGRRGWQVVGGAWRAGEGWRVVSLGVVAELTRLCEARNDRDLQSVRPAGAAALTRSLLTCQRETID